MPEQPINFYGLLSQLLFATTIINTITFLPNGKERRGNGTGFFFKYEYENSESITAIITNRHVMVDADAIELFIHSGEEKETHISFKPGFALAVDNIQDYCIYPTRGNVDLCAIIISPILEQEHIKKQNPLPSPWKADAIRDDSGLSNLGAIHPVYVVGYPAGFFDTEHNYPIIRQGITATPPFVDFKNKLIKDYSVFLVDVKAIRGSSGSPVVLYYRIHYEDYANARKVDGQVQGEIKSGSKMLLIGVLQGFMPAYVPGVIIDEEGKAKKRERVRAETENIGIAVRAKEIKAMKDYVYERYQEIFAGS